MSRLTAWCLCCGALALSMTARVDAAVISVGPYTASATMPFVVPIQVSGAVDLASFTFDLAFDPDDFAINTACDPFSDPFCDLLTGPVTQGTFYTAGAIFPPLFNPGFILLDGMARQTGLLLGVNGAWQDPGPAPSGSGILAFVEFVAIPGGTLTSPITIVGVAPPAVVPEPATLFLMMGGMLFLSIVRRARPFDERNS